jgi:multidrug efflux pump subunit AcrA (membrane-fusion protein)
LNARGVYIAVSCVWAAAVLLTSCRTTKTQEAAAATAQAVKPVAVGTASVVAKQIAKLLYVTGTLTADETSNLAAVTGGEVKATPAAVGSFVREGEVIVQLDSTDAKLRATQAQAAAEQAAIALEQAHTHVTLGADGKFDPALQPEVLSAKATADMTESQAKLARQNLARYTNLMQTGDISNSAFEQAYQQSVAAIDQAKSAQQAYLSSLTRARQGYQGIDSLKAAQSAAQAQLAMAQRAAEGMTIRAPFSGMLAARLVSVGEFVPPGGRVATLVRANPVQLIAQTPEADSALLRQGLRVVIRVAAFPNRDFSGAVQSVGATVDAASRTASVQARIENQEGLLRPGMFASGTIALASEESAMFVPESAVVSTAGRSSTVVYTVADNVARASLVRTGERAGGLVQIVSGLTSGQIVVTEGAQSLSDGAAVTLRR